MISLIIVLALLLAPAGLSEELGEVDLYAPGVHIGAYAAEVPPTVATQTVTLTDAKATAQMNIGETLQILVNEGEVGVFASKRPERATVDENGLVTALAKGTATIWFRPKGGKRRTLRIKIADPYAPTGVSIAQGSVMTLNVGNAVQLNAVLAPEGARATLAWKSSKPKVAAVDENGVVTARRLGKATITVKAAKGISAALAIQVIEPGDTHRLPEMNLADYNGETFRVVNTVVNPIAYAALVRDKVCTSPGRTGRYSGNCLGFCYYYVYCMVDNITDVKVSVALSRYMTSDKLRYATEKYGNPDTMMANLYDLLSAGLPQILMVEAITHPGSRHFVAVVGYRASVSRREDLRPEDLLIIDSFDGKLESMDPAIEPIETRVLFKQEGQYRIEAVRRK